MGVHDGARCADFLLALTSSERERLTVRSADSRGAEFMDAVKSCSVRPSVCAPVTVWQRNTDFCRVSSRVCRGLFTHHKAVCVHVCKYSTRITPPAFRLT